MVAVTNRKQVARQHYLFLEESRQQFGTTNKGHKERQKF